MSMISAQCDVLRDAADELAKVTNGIRSGVPASTWHGMTYVFDNAAHRLRQAADTIWELRCKPASAVDQQKEIERLKAENEKLRELVLDIWSDGMTLGTARKLKAENDKLRELVKNLYECNGSCERCVELMGRCEYKEQLAEFGIEAGE